MMNKKGFAISSFLYSILALFLVILSMLLINLTNTKLTIEKLKKQVKIDLSSNMNDMSDKFIKIIVSEQNVTIKNNANYNILEGVSVERHDGKKLDIIPSYTVLPNFDTNIPGIYMVKYTVNLNGVLYTNFKTINVVLKKSYSLTVDLDGGTNNQDTSYSITEDDSITINKPFKNNYVFVGWLVDGAGSIINGTTFTMGNAPATLTAQWTPTITDFFCTKTIQEFIVPVTGNYKLEVWGGSGGYAYNTSYSGGYGGYSTGTIYLTQNTTLYVYVGGKGTDGTSKTSTSFAGGYNGGGNGFGHTDKYSGGGGGATHIATSSGLLNTLSSNKDAILIVAGGGGGASYETGSYYGRNGHGGGFTGVSAQKSGSYSSTGGTQTAGGTGGVAGSFGQGANRTNNGSGGGGGGFYGGGSASVYGGASGGSGFIDNINLIDKYMYCYGCTVSSNSSTLTYTTNNVSSVALSDYAKQGDGYAKITCMEQ